MWVASGPVTTTGINWESVGAIAAIMGIIVGFMTWWVTHRDRRQRVAGERVEQAITDAVNHLSDVLMAKLETKEKVSQISERLARLEGAAGSAQRGNSDAGQS